MRKNLRTGRNCHGVGTIKEINQNISPGACLIASSKFKYSCLDFMENNTHTQTHTPGCQERNIIKTTKIIQPY